MRPKREPARRNGQTYFLTFNTAERKPLFRHERWALLFVRVLGRYEEYALHDFVLMPDHVHLLVTPNGALERTTQLLKGGYSFAARRAFDWNDAVWQPGSSDHRIRDDQDWDVHVAYIAKNVASLRTEGYRFCGRGASLPLSPAPPWLKPRPAGEPDWPS